MGDTLSRFQKVGSKRDSDDVIHTNESEDIIDINLFDYKIKASLLDDLKNMKSLQESDKVKNHMLQMKRSPIF